MPTSFSTPGEGESRYSRKLVARNTEFKGGLSYGNAGLDCDAETAGVGSHLIASRCACRQASRGIGGRKLLKNIGETLHCSGGGRA